MEFLKFCLASITVILAAWAVFKVTEDPTPSTPPKELESKPEPHPEPPAGLTPYEEMLIAMAAMHSTRRAELQHMRDCIRAGHTPAINICGYENLRFSPKAMDALLETDIEAENAALTDLLKQIRGQSDSTSNDKAAFSNYQGSGSQSSGQSNNFTISGKV